MTRRLLYAHMGLRKKVRIQNKAKKAAIKDRRIKLLRTRRLLEKDAASRGKK